MTTMLSNVLPKERKNWFWLVVLAVIALWPWFSGVFVLHLAILTCLNVCSQRAQGDPI